MLLACVMPNLDKLAEVFTYRFHNPSRIDSTVAQELADSLGFPLKKYFKKPNSLTSLKDMRLKMGWSGYRGELLALAMIEELPQDYIFLRGNIMELLRANQWRPYVIDPPLNIRHGIRRIGVGANGKRENVRDWVPEYQAWFDALPTNAKDRCYDFGFVEFLLPNTQGAYFNAFHRNPFVNPFNDRRIIELSMRFPVADRLNRSILDLFLERTNKDLLEYRFH